MCGKQKKSIEQKSWYENHRKINGMWKVSEHKFEYYDVYRSSIKYVKHVTKIDEKWKKRECHFHKQKNICDNNLKVFPCTSFCTDRNNFTNFLQFSLKLSNFLTL